MSELAATTLKPTFTAGENAVILKLAELFSPAPASDISAALAVTLRQWLANREAIQ